MWKLALGFLLVLELGLQSVSFGSKIQENTYPQSKYFLDIQPCKNTRGEKARDIARRYPDKFVRYWNGSFYDFENRGEQDGIFHIGLQYINGEDKSGCPSGYRRGVFIQTTIVKIGRWDELKKLYPNPLTAAEGILILKNGKPIDDTQGFDEYFGPYVRTILGIDHNGDIRVSRQRGSLSTIRQKLKRRGIIDAISLDGGHSCSPGARIYNVFGIVRKASSKRYQEYIWRQGWPLRLQNQPPTVAAPIPPPGQPSVGIFI